MGHMVTDDEQRGGEKMRVLLSLGWERRRKGPDEQKLDESVA